MRSWIGGDTPCWGQLRNDAAARTLQAGDTTLHEGDLVGMFELSKDVVRFDLCCPAGM